MFSAFSPLNGGQMSTYYRDNEYPYDLNGALDYTRPATGFSIFPFPLTIGHIEGLIPQFNNLEFSLMRGKTPFGPWLGDNQNIDGALNFAFPDIMGGLSKSK